jgi:predicted 3-demethylubiquinone-9 3-methyltransferase (glyoxalase superfamily)
MAKAQLITPFLWFKNEAESAAKFYVKLFKHSKLGKITRYGDAGPGPKGEVMVVDFTLGGGKMIALNGNTHFPITPSVSLFVTCATQAEVNAIWNRLLKAGAKPMACGWITDHFGITWQIVPDGLLPLISHPAGMKAMMGQIKLDITAVRRAVDAARKAEATAAVTSTSKRKTVSKK